MLKLNLYEKLYYETVLGFKVFEEGLKNI